MSQDENPRGVGAKTSKNQQKFMQDFDKKFQENLELYQFKAEKQKQMVKTFEAIKRVLEAHGRFGKTDEPHVSLGLKGIDDTDIFGVDSVVDRMFAPRFDKEQFIFELLQIRVAKFKDDSSVFLTFKNGTGYITDPRLNQLHREYMRIMEKI